MALNPLQTTTLATRVREATTLSARMGGAARRVFAAALAATAVVLVSPPLSGTAAQQTVAVSTEQKLTVDSLSEHFAAVPTMSGEFLQFNPNGEQTAGTFYIERPGKIRFNYEKPSPMEVISNGKTVAVHNRKLKTWDFYPLDKTPLKLLLSDKIEYNAKTIKNVVSEDDLTTIVMGDEQVFGNSEITLMFDPKTFDLRQWTVRDARGSETSVMVFNVQKNVTIPAKLFKFDELALQRQQQQQNNPNR